MIVLPVKMSDFPSFEKFYSEFFSPHPFYIKPLFGEICSVDSGEHLSLRPLSPLTTIVCSLYPSQSASWPTSNDSCRLASVSRCILHKSDSVWKQTAVFCETARAPEDKWNKTRWVWRRNTLMWGTGLRAKCFMKKGWLMYSQIKAVIFYLEKYVFLLRRLLKNTDIWT